MTDIIVRKLGYINLSERLFLLQTQAPAGTNDAPSGVTLDLISQNWVDAIALSLHSGLGMIRHDRLSADIVMDCMAADIASKKYPTWMQFVTLYVLRAYNRLEGVIPPYYMQYTNYAINYIHLVVNHLDNMVKTYVPRVFARGGIEAESDAGKSSAYWERTHTSSALSHFAAFYNAIVSAKDAYAAQLLAYFSVTLSQTVGKIDPLMYEAYTVGDLVYAPSATPESNLGAELWKTITNVSAADSMYTRVDATTLLKEYVWTMAGRRILKVLTLPEQKLSPAIWAAIKGSSNAYQFIKKDLPSTLNQIVESAVFQSDITLAIDAIEAAKISAVSTTYRGVVVQTDGIKAIADQIAIAMHSYLAIRDSGTMRLVADVLMMNHPTQVTVSAPSVENILFEYTIGSSVGIYWNVMMLDTLLVNGVRTFIHKSVSLVESPKLSIPRIGYSITSGFYYKGNGGIVPDLPLVSEYLYDVGANLNAGVNYLESVPLHKLVGQSYPFNMTYNGFSWHSALGLTASRRMMLATSLQPIFANLATSLFMQDRSFNPSWINNEAEVIVYRLAIGALIFDEITKFLYGKNPRIATAVMTMYGVTKPVVKQEISYTSQSDDIDVMKLTLKGSVSPLLERLGTAQSANTKLANANAAIRLELTKARQDTSDIKSMLNKRENDIAEMQDRLNELNDQISKQKVLATTNVASSPQTAVAEAEKAVKADETAVQSKPKETEPDNVEPPQADK